MNSENDIIEQNVLCDDMVKEDKWSFEAFQKQRINFEYIVEFGGYPLELFEDE